MEGQGGWGDTEDTTHKRTLSHPSSLCLSVARFNTTCVKEGDVRRFPECSSRLSVLPCVLGSPQLGGSHTEGFIYFSCITGQTQAARGNELLANHLVTNR